MPEECISNDYGQFSGPDAIEKTRKSVELFLEGKIPRYTLYGVHGTFHGDGTLESPMYTCGYLDRKGSSYEELENLGLIKKYSSFADVNGKIYTRAGRQSPKSPIGYIVVDKTFPSGHTTKVLKMVFETKVLGISFVRVATCYTLQPTLEQYVNFIMNLFKRDKNPEHEGRGFDIFDHIRSFLVSPPHPSPSSS